MKKFLCILLSLIMVFSIINMPAVATNQAKVVYVVNGNTQQEITGLNIGENYMPDRLPEVLPDGKNFIGWRDENGALVENNGITLENEVTNLYAVFNDKYLIDKTAFILKDKTENQNIYAPYLYDNNYHGSVFYEINGGYGPKEDITEGKDAPYTRFVSGEHNGKSVSLLFDENGVALTGEWNKTYSITFKYRITDINAKIHLQTVFGVKKEFAEYTNADKINEGKILRAGRTNQLKSRWNYDLIGGANEYWFHCDPAEEQNFNIVENGFEEWRSVTFTVNTGNENSEYLPVFGIYVNVGKQENAIEIKDITVSYNYNANLEYVVNGEVVSVDEKAQIGQECIVDYIPKNTETHYFDGWYLDSELKNKAPTSFVLEEKTTLYAKFLEYKTEYANLVIMQDGTLKDENNNDIIVSPDGKYKIELVYAFENTEMADSYAEYCLSTCGKSGKTVRLEPSNVEGKVTLYITTERIENYIDKCALQNLTLCPVEANGSGVVIKKAELSKISAVTNGGVSILKTDNPADNQAIRFYFGYDTENSTDIFVGNSNYQVVSRGILLAKGIEASRDIKRGDADSKYILDINTTELYKCWNAKSYDNETEQLFYSCFVKDIKAINGDYNNNDRFYARGYVVYKKGNNVYTIYSAATSCTVKEVATINSYHNEGNYALTNEKGRKLVWNLEFEEETKTSELSDRLNTSIHTMTPDWDVLRFANDEEHYFLDNGSLVLRLTKDEETDKFKTAPCLTTTDRMAFKYGYVEMRAKMDFGYYMFYSWWMQPDKKLLPENFRYYGEIDIFETWWQARGLTFSVGKWYNGYEGAIGQYETGTDVSKHEGNYKFTFPKDVNLKDEYHIYGFEWTDEYLKAYVDGYCYYTIYIDEANDYSSEYPGMECFHDYYYLCWNNWMYITHAEETVLENGYADYAIDYIRIYQNKNEDIFIY